MISVGQHKIVNVSPPREWDSKYGPMHSYTLRFEGDDASYELSQKPTSPPPQIDQTIDVATVTPDPNGKFPAKIKKAQQGAGGGFGGGKMDPAREKRITHMHSEEMAILTLGLAQKLGIDVPAKTVGELVPIIEQLADTYDKKVGV